MNTLRQNILANLTGRSWINLLNLIFIPIYLRFIGIEAWALVGFYIIVLNTVALMDLGLSPTINRELARLSAAGRNIQEQRDTLRTLETVYWFVAAIIGLAIWYLAPFIATEWLDKRELPIKTVVTSIRLMGLMVVFQLPFTFYQNGLAGLEKQIKSNIILAGGGTIRSVATVLILWLVSKSIEAFFVTQLIVTIFQTIIIVVTTWKQIPQSNLKPIFQKSIISNNWQFSTNISVNTILGVLLTQIDKIVLSKLLSLTEFGYYMLAWTIASALWTLTTPVNIAIFPRFTKFLEVGNEQSLIKLYHRSSQFIALLIIPAATVLAFYSYEVMLIWSGDPAGAVYVIPILMMLAIGNAINGIVSIPAHLQTAAGWPQLMMRTNLGASLVILPFLWFVIKYFGGIGAASLWVILNVTYLLFTIPLMHKRLLISEKKNWYLKDFLLPVAISIISVWFSQIFMPEQPTKIQMFIVPVCGWLIAVVACSLLLHYIREELLRLADKYNKKI